MVKIRLRRVGSKKQTSFRVVVADSRAPRDGRFIEEIGFYNPRTEPETLRVDEARALHWLTVGAQPTDSVTRLLKTLGTLGRFERLKQGEPLEDLVAEAEMSEEEEVEETPVAEAPEEIIEEETEAAEAEESLETEVPAVEEEAEEAKAEGDEGEPEPEADQPEEEDDSEE
jgi:small subunit ribosomal protein S16